MPFAEIIGALHFLETAGRAVELEPAVPGGIKTGGFRIRGRHDPPQRQELRVSIAEFISREFLNRELPLPSGTGIDLTLDTTLNANQLVGDLLELNRARNGEPDTTP